MRLRKRERFQGGLISRAVINPLVQFAGVISYAILLVMRVPLMNVIGDAGIGLFAPAFELFFLITLFTSYAMTNAISGIIRYRVKREQYRNARRVFRAAFFMDFFVSIAAVVAIVAASRIIADILVLEPLSRMAVMAAAPVIIFASFIGTFRGYFNGYGLGTLTAHSQYIESISMVVCVLFSSGLFYDYGLKIAALKQNGALAYAYGALGAMLGVMLSQFITTIHLLMMYVIYAGTLRGKLGMDGSKRMETQYSMQRMILDNGVPIAVVAILTNVFMLIDQRMFNYCMNKRELGEVKTALWGNYYGKFAVFIGVGAAFGVLSVHTLTGRISSAYEREEYRVMRDRIGKAVRRLCIVVFPIAVYMAVLSNAAVTFLFDGENGEVISWIQKGTAIIVLYGFSFLFGQLLYRVHMIRELLFTTLLSLLIHVLAAYLLVQRAYLGADGIVYSQIIFFAVYAALNFFFISRNLKYRQEWFGGVVFPAVAAGVSGVVVGLANSLLLEPVGGGLTVLIGVVAGLFFYITFLMILRVIGEAELSKLPLGFFFIMLGKNIGVLR
ncbi:MAG: polysaccharide biosynthesis C-terminal domain-containing protein [Lachnospiraceae bacterium]|nr:polysaccharide biosynthesis C-terminal domain-containing protein [Lachnospiraceae bacterium]